MGEINTIGLDIAKSVGNLKRYPASVPFGAETAFDRR